MKISNRVYKKIILGSSLLLGLVVAMPVFAVIVNGVATGSAGSGISDPSQAVNIKGGISAMPTIQGVPCEFNEPFPKRSMMNGSNPCNYYMQYGKGELKDFTNKRQWYELMFVLTVMMVWVVLLLLIALLLKLLKKHKIN